MGQQRGVAPGLPIPAFSRIFFVKAKGWQGVPDAEAFVRPEWREIWGLSVEVIFVGALFVGRVDGQVVFAVEASFVVVSPFLSRDFLFSLAF